MATSDTYLPASERRSAFIVVMAEDWSSIALIVYLTCSLVVADALRSATPAFRAFKALIFAFRASAIGFGSETGAGIELLNSSNLVNYFVAKVVNSSFVTKLLSGSSAPAHDPDLAMESMAPSTAVFVVTVRGLLSDP